MNPIEPLDHNIHLVPLIPNDRPNRISGYLIRGPRNVLVETGSSPSNPVIQSALNSLSMAPEQIDAIVVTHIHLDHAGGAGKLMQQCPNAKLLVHPNGKKHLCQPQRLIEGARKVYGTEFETLFSPILPVPEDRIVPVTTGDRFELGDGREIRFFEAFGHARHHIIAFDNQSRGIFSGDIAGVFQDRIQKKSGRVICFPNTAPTQFDPAEMKASYDLMMGLKPETLYFSHFGRVGSAIAVLEAAKAWIPFFSEECVKYYRQHPSQEKLAAYLQQRMLDSIIREGVSPDSIDQALLAFDNGLNAQGIIAYVQRLEKMA